MRKVGFGDAFSKGVYVIIGDKSREHWAYAAILALFLGLFVSIPQPSQATVSQSDLETTLGTEFYLAFSGQSGTLRAIYLSSTEDANAVIYWPNGTTQSSQISAGLVQTIDATSKVGVQQSGAESINNQTVRIISDQPISVYYINYRSATTDASSAIPVSSLGTEYVVMSYRPSFTADSEKSRLNVIATSPGTTSITITPTVNLVGGRSANQSFSLDLSQGQVFSTVGQVSNADLSGTIVESDAPISVMTSTYLNTYLISGTSRAADNIFEEMIPVSAWDTNYILAMSPGYAFSQRDLYRVFASEDGTVLEVNGVAVGTLNRGEWYEFDSSNTGARADVVSASAPVGVMQYLRGSVSGYRATPSSGGTDGDPAMIAVPSTNQFLSDYVITTPASGFGLNMLVLVAPISAKGQITLDGTTIPAASFTDIPSTSYSVARVEISLGAHYVRGSERFGLSVMGFTSADSYAYSGGFGLVATPGGYAAALDNAPPTAPFSAGGDSISGSPVICSTVSVAEGTWTDGRSAILSTSYRWLRNGQAIEGATSSSYEITAADAGTVISAQISKTNAIGTTVANADGKPVLDLRLASLTSSIGAVSPSLSDCESNYSLVTSASSLTITAGAIDVDTRLDANGIEFLSGGTSVPFDLELGSNTITLNTYQGDITFSRTIEVARTDDPVIVQTARDLGQTQVDIESTLFPNLSTISSITTWVALDPGFTTGLTSHVLSPVSYGGTSPITVSASITGLSPTTVYYSKTSADYSGGTVESPVAEFMTLAAPTVDTLTYSPISSTSATLTLLMNSQSQTINFVGFDYSLDENLSSDTTRVTATYDNVPGPPARYAATITGLPAGKTIYYRAIGSNTTGTNSGIIKSFVLTSSPEGTVSASVSTTTVDFSGEIKTFGSRTTQVVVRYGKVSNLSSGTTDLPLTPSIIESIDPVSVSGSLENLDPNTVYYAQLRVISSAGSLAGPIFSFTTGSVPSPTLQILAPTEVLKTDVVTVFFAFSEGVSGFSKAGVDLSGNAVGWTTQPVRQISPSLYSMEIRPSSPSTGSLVVQVANGAASTSATTQATPASSVTITVSSVAPTSITYLNLTISGKEGEALIVAGPVIGGASPTAFSAVPALPSGLILEASGAISGTPATGTAGTTNHVIRALGGSGTPSVSLTITIAQGENALAGAGSSGSGVPYPGSSIMEITSFSSRVLGVEGGEITAHGRKLGGLTEATLGGLPLIISENTDEKLTFISANLPIGVWDLRLVGPNGTLTFQQAITISLTEAAPKSSGELVGWTFTLRFDGNSRSLSRGQSEHLQIRSIEFLSAQTLVCWGYTTSDNPNAWAVAHARARAEAACSFIAVQTSDMKTVIRLRYGQPKDLAMRASLQFWK